MARLSQVEEVRTEATSGWESVTLSLWVSDVTVKVQSDIRVRAKAEAGL